MKEKFKYEWEEKTGILHKHYFGEIEFEDFKKSWDYLKENTNFLTSKKLYLLDYRKGSINIVFAQKEEVLSYYRNNPDIFDGARIAVIIQNHRDITIPAILEIQSGKYQVKNFYTKRAACDWLLLTN